MITSKVSETKRRADEFKRLEALVFVVEDDRNLSLYKLREVGSISVCAVYREKLAQKGLLTRAAFNG